jgi:hypothetical protein
MVGKAKMAFVVILKNFVATLNLEIIIAICRLRSQIHPKIYP